MNELINELIFISIVIVIVTSLVTYCIYELYDGESSCIHTYVSPYEYWVIDETTKPTPHPLTDVIHAFADGYKVQFKNPATRKWEDAETPVFGIGEYRIKPATNETLQEAEEALLAVHVKRVELENAIKQMEEIA